MDKATKILLSLAVIATIVMISVIYSTRQVGVKIGDSGSPAYFESATMGSVSVSAATSTKVLAANAVRQYASICNDSANKVYLSFGKAAVATSGYIMAANTCFVMNSNLFIGQINAIASSSTSSLFTIEK